MKQQELNRKQLRHDRYIRWKTNNPDKYERCINARRQWRKDNPQKHKEQLKKYNEKRKRKNLTENVGDILRSGLENYSISSFEAHEAPQLKLNQQSCLNDGNQRAFGFEINGMKEIGGQFVQSSLKDFDLKKAEQLSPNDLDRLLTI